MVRGRRTADALVGATLGRPSLRRPSREAVRLETASLGHDRAGSAAAAPLAASARGPGAGRQVARGGPQDAGGGARRSHHPPRSARVVGQLRASLPAVAPAGPGSRRPRARAASAVVREGLHRRGGRVLLARGMGKAWKQTVTTYFSLQVVNQVVHLLDARAA